MNAFRNVSWGRIFFIVNILLLSLALIRMQYMASKSTDTSYKHQSNTRTLQSTKSVDTSNLRYQEQLVQLQSQLDNLTTLLAQEKHRRYDLEQKMVHFKDTAKNANENALSQSRQKLGQDVDSSREFQVPNIVHYIWYNTEPAPFQFHHMLSVLSAHKFIKPDIIYFHTDIPPTGKYWDRIQSIPEFKINKRNPPFKAFNEEIKPPKFYTSHSNVDRILVLMEYGGIYMDFDFIAIRSFDDLRKYVCTIGLESDVKSCGSVIVSSKDAFFLYLWINAYFDDYQIDEWAYNTGQVPFNLAKRYPELVHVERTKLNRPNFAELNEIWGKRTWWNWKENYGYHSWYRLAKDGYGGNWFNGTEPDEENVKTLDNAFGEIARLILYDTTDFIR